MLYLLLKKTAFGKAPHAVQQAVIGVCFGGLAIFFTEYGIHMGDAILDIRSAAPLTAGLLFGWPSGLIAGEGIIGILLAVFAIITVNGKTIGEIIDLSARGINLGNLGGLVFFAVLIYTIYLAARKGEKAAEA